ncbi:hypothetical protein ACWFNE_02555 [Cellulomonas sp. NPDC055163]
MALMPGKQREDEIDYLRRIEALAKEVVEHAGDEPWFAHGEEGQQAAEPLHRAVNELAASRTC